MILSFFTCGKRGWRKLVIPLSEGIAFSFLNIEEERHAPAQGYEEREHHEDAESDGNRDNDLVFRYRNPA